MIRRLFRFSVSFLCLLSLLVFLGVSWLWWRSNHGGRDRISVLRAGNRYTVDSAAGRLTLVGPPAPAADRAVRRAADLAAAGLRDEQLLWGASFGKGDAGEIVLFADTPFTRYKSPAHRFVSDIAYADKARPLLAALEDPARFAAAHVLLQQRPFTGPQGELFIRVSGRVSFVPAPDIPELHGRSDRSAEAFARKYTDVVWGHADYEGLRVTLRRHPKDHSEGVASNGEYYVFLLGESHPAGMSAIRDRWHRELDVPYQSTPYWALVAATALPPLLWSGVRVRRAWVRRRRRRMGLCLACGYDLRGSRGRCGECGRPIPAAR